jgi:hypothetical protein
VPSPRSEATKTRSRRSVEYGRGIDVLHRMPRQRQTSRPGLKQPEIRSSRRARLPLHVSFRLPIKYRAPRRRAYSSALTISSHIFFASPNSIIVLSR